MSTDIDDTSNCPVGEVCTQCGTRDELGVATFAVDMGVLCATVCKRCTEQEVVWQRLPLMVGVEGVLAHCGHVGVDLDGMAEAMESEQQAAESRERELEK